MKKEVGIVTIEERDEIQSLYERRNGLKELAGILSADDNSRSLYEKLVSDMGETTTKFQSWWDDKSKVYQWESAVNGSWEIDFNTCKIYLITQD